MEADTAEVIALDYERPAPPLIELDSGAESDRPASETGADDGEERDSRAEERRQRDTDPDYVPPRERPLKQARQDAQEPKKRAKFRRAEHEKLRAQVNEQLTKARAEGRSLLNVEFTGWLTSAMDRHLPGAPKLSKTLKRKFRDVLGVAYGQGGLPVPLQDQPTDREQTLTADDHRAAEAEPSQPEQSVADYRKKLRLSR